MIIRSRFNLGERTGAVKFTAPSLVQPQFLESTSIDYMIRRAVMGDSSVFCRPQYLDVLNSPDSYHDAASRCAMASSIWHDLPDSVKATYGSPDRLLEEFDSMQQHLSVSPDNKSVITPDNPSTPVTADKADASSTDAART